jgi:D-alanine-D-alanine ligase
MLIGLTYDLKDDYLAMGFSEHQVAEFDSPRTIEAIEQTLQSMGHQVQRIGHIRNLIDRLNQGKRWELVFNIAEGIAGFGREAQVPALLDAYGIPYTFSDPLTLCLSLHKGMAKQVVQNMNLLTPSFEVIEELDQLESLNIGFPLFVKPVAEGTGLGVDSSSMVDDPLVLRKVCRDLLTRFNQPVLVERYLSGREFTVGLVGSGKDAQAVGVLEVIQNETGHPLIYSNFNKENWQQTMNYRLVSGDVAEKARTLALAVWQGLGCRDAGRVDLRCNPSGTPFFLEVNPLAGLHPEHSDLPILCNLAGNSYQWLIENIINSAIKRPSIDSGPQNLGLSEIGTGLRGKGHENRSAA